ncbi:MAG: Sau3AI family type II restriction endonuclease [Methanomethylophilus sp.]|jgi:DNA mismatch repair protein MutH
MPNTIGPVDYDENDPQSILRYAERLVNHTLREMVPGIVDERRGKGGFGQLVETGYFKIETNSEPVPDFDEAGMELKTTPMKRTAKGLVSKERLVLNMINYMDILDKGFEGTFMEKDAKILLIFYLYEKEKSRLDYMFLKCKIIDFTDSDLRIIRDDWNKIAEMVDKGRAEDISCGMTMYLEAAPKGQGHGKDLTEQPHSPVKAQRRAFALKSSFVTFLYRNWGTTNLDDTVGEWDESKSFEDEIIGRFSRFYGMTAEEISVAVGVEPGFGGKSQYAILVRRMVGVKGKRIDEFEKAGLIVKTVRLKRDGVPKESMSFRQMDYVEVANQKWEDSDFYEDLNKRFLFLVFKESDGGLVFSKAMFWDMPKEDLEEAHRVWEEARTRIRAGDYGNLPKMKDSPIAHVRPHAQNKDDTSPTPQGGKEMKRCFWLRNTYIADIISGQRKID